LTRWLIVNADDFGLSESVSRGIIKAHQQGILTSTTFMVNFPWAAEMAPLLREVPQLGVGIHLNLTTGSPVLPPEQVPTLLGSNGKLSKRLFHLRFRVDLAEAKREWSAQVEKGIALLGRTPTHLDTHRYLQGYPGFTQVMLEVARTYNIPAVRSLYPGPEMLPPSLLKVWNPAGILVSQYLRRSVALTKASGVQRPDATMSGDFDLAGLLGKLERLSEGVTELICHPGELDDRLRSLSSLREQREVELAALTSPEARAKVDALGIQMVNFAHFAES
jgi:predicted glycoside hydrolase/deacetylase ChbG (UPF0249 family)